MEYIPGYTILKNIASIPEKAVSKHKSVYELFENSSSSSAPSTLSYIYDMIYGSSSSSTANSNARSNTKYALESNFPRWSAELQYHRGDGVHLNGFLYTSVKDSSNINPVLSVTDDFITVNSDFWTSRGLSSKVKQYNSDTDSSNVYPYRDIVDFDGMLYQCAAPGTGCTTDYTKPQWTKLSQDYIRPLTVSPSNTSNAIRLSPVQEASIYGVLGIYSILNDLTIQDIPGETLSDTFWRCVKIYYPYVLNILIFILAVVFASFSANDLLHKHYLYRVLAFLYTFYYVNSQGILSFCIFAYYLVRSLGGSYLDMNPLKIYGILPIWEDPSYNSTSFVPTLLTYPLSLRQYIEEGKEIAKANRLASHGNVVKFLRDALHLQKPKRDIGLGEVLDPMNKGRGPAPRPGPGPGQKGPTGTQGPTGGVQPTQGEGAPWLRQPVLSPSQYAVPPAPAPAQGQPP